MLDCPMRQLDSSALMKTAGMRETQPHGMMRLEFSSPRQYPAFEMSLNAKATHMHAEPPRFPENRPRRLRQNKAIRSLVRESRLAPEDLIWPLFICEGGENQPVPSMPGIERLTVRNAVAAAKEALELGIPAIALFPLVEESEKSADCRAAWDPGSLVCRATREIRGAVPDILVMLDVALDPYNPKGHDGIVSQDGRVLNDETLEALERQALVQARSGAQILGPSDMMDGRIGVIRKSLESAGLQDTMIMSYSAKFASCLYGPFREAVGSSLAPDGDKKTYQIDPANASESLRMIARDISEGADMVMVKPGMPYLDICQRAAEAFSAPVFAYQVSGEYSMLASSRETSGIDPDMAILESLLAFRRAGCSGVLTYAAPRAARLLS